MYEYYNNEFKFYWQIINENFVKLIKDIGHIPNGNRIYYNKRSQPPLFISMVQAYYEVSLLYTFLHLFENCPNCYTTQGFIQWLSGQEGVGS